MLYSSQTCLDLGHEGKFGCFEEKLHPVLGWHPTVLKITEHHSVKYILAMYFFVYISEIGLVNSTTSPKMILFSVRKIELAALNVQMTSGLLVVEVHYLVIRELDSWF